MTLLKKFAVLWFSLLIVACGNAAEEPLTIRGDAQEMSSIETDDMFMESAVELDRTDLAQQMQRLIIKTGSMNVEVDDIDIAVGNATSYIIGLGGYVQAQDISGSGRYRSATLTLGVPVEQFENALATFRAYGEVNSENATGQDVTEEFVDLNSRLTNLQATQTRLRELYEEATNVEETLEVDRELRRVEEEINVVQGRMEYLSERAAFSSITLNFSSIGEPIVTEPKAWDLGFTANQAVADLQYSAQNLADTLIYFAIAVLPLLLIFGLIAWVLFAIGRRIYRRVKPTD